MELIAKYAAAGALYASVYVLVWKDKLKPETYVAFVAGALSALGINVVAGAM